MQRKDVPSGSLLPKNGFGDRLRNAPLGPGMESMCSLTLWNEALSHWHWPTLLHRQTHPAASRHPSGGGDYPVRLRRTPPPDSLRSVGILDVLHEYACGGLGRAALSDRRFLRLTRVS